MALVEETSIMMQEIRLGRYLVLIDAEATKEYYKDKSTFLCQCPDCQNYLAHIESVITMFAGLDSQLGIDLTKDVGIGADELMAHEYENQLLYVIPYYIIGHVKEYNNENYQLSDTVSLLLNARNYKQNMKIEKDAFCIWLELTLPLQKTVF